MDTSGAGPELVIIHSLLTGPEAFDGVVGSLENDHTVHRVYLPGFGASTPLIRGSVSITDLADFVATAMGAVGCSPLTSVLGNGLGAFVALKLAIEHGESFGSLIASNCGAGFSSERRVAFTNMSHLAMSGGMAAVADVALKRIFPAQFQAAHPAALGERRLVLEMIDPGAFSAACLALATLDLSEQLSEISKQTMIIAGEIDQTTPPEMGRAAASSIPDAQFELIAECGHCPQIEQPEALVRVLRGFLDG